MKHLLLPTDFSLNALSALHYAYELGRYAEADLTLLHVASNGIHDEEAALYQLREVSDEVHNHFKGAGPELTFNYRLQHGQPVEGIKQQCDAYPYHLVVMGTKGAGETEVANVGSVTCETIRQVKLPVLAVPHFAEFKPIERIVYAVDYTDFDADRMKSLKAFADVFEGEITLLHINQSRDSLSEEQFENYKRMMVATTDFEKLRFDFIGGSNVITSLDQYLLDKSADLLAMTTRKGHLLEETFSQSMTRIMVMYSRIPVLAFHD